MLPRRLGAHQIVCTLDRVGLVGVLLQNRLHDLSVEEMRVYTVPKIMEQTRQNDALVLFFGEWR